MAMMIARIPAEPVWEVKCALALHQWLLAEEVEALRTRIAEMRSPVPRLDTTPDPGLEAFLEALARASSTAELLSGTYGVGLRALVDACDEHVARTNPLVDHPTRRLLRLASIELREALDWAERARSALGAFDPVAVDESRQWVAHVDAYL